MKKTVKRSARSQRLRSLLWVTSFVLGSASSSNKNDQQIKHVDATQLGHPPQQLCSIPRGGNQASLWKTAVDDFWQGNPLLAGGLVCAVKAALADVVAQKLQVASSSAAKLDFRRTFAFMTYGGLYQGVIQGLVFNNFYTYLFGNATTPIVVTKKVLFNAFVHDSLVCIPMAYIVKAIVFHYSVQTALQEYWKDVRYQGLLLKNHAIWIPVSVGLFTVVQPHYRTTVLAMVSFFWMILLSSISSGPK